MPLSPSLVVVSLAGEAAPKVQSQGPFGEVRYLAMPEGGGLGWVEERLAAVDLAEKAGADWIAFLDRGEALADDTLDLIAPSLDLFDAIFGAVHVGDSGEPVARLSRLAFDTPERLPHALLNWWMPQGHFVRTATARDTLARLEAGQGDPHLAYLFDIWSHARCQKSAQPLLVLDREPQPLGEAGRAEVLRRLSEKPVFMPVIHGNDTYLLPYTGRNAGIERDQTRGQFFEAAELEELRKLVRPGARIVDVGANTGNHTVFFAGPMRAASVLPIEPLPGAIAALRAAVERNALTNVDLSRLGTGVGESSGRARLVSSERGGLGATSLVPDPGGDILVAKLDSMVSGPVDFLKIDVEGMEMGVLSGAEGVIERSRPAIFIEIANRNTAAFSAWLERARYEVKRVFTDKGHANYFVAPKGRS